MKRLSRFFICMLIVCIPLACVDSPVDEDYFMDGTKIDGGLKPTPPGITVARTGAVGNYTIAVTIDTTGSDPNNGTRSGLTYYIYFSTGYPSFSDPHEFYDIRHYVAGTTEATLVSAGTRTVGITATKDTVYYFWVTSFNGGRESDHSNIATW